MSRGEEYIQEQLAVLAAHGGMRPRDPVGPGPREPWRAVIGAVLFLGGISLWIAGHLHRIDTTTHPDDDIVALVRSANLHLCLEMVGVGTAIVGAIWLVGQVRPRQRTYSRTGVRQAWTIGVLCAAGVVLWTISHLYVDVLSGFILLVLVVLLQTGFITRVTGPNGRRNPVDDPRGRMINRLTPWPVVLAGSIAFVLYLVVDLVT